MPRCSSCKVAREHILKGAMRQIISPLLKHTDHTVCSTCIGGHKQLGRLKMTEPWAGGSQTHRQWYSTRKQQSSLLPAHINTPHHVPQVRGLGSAPPVSPKPYCWHFTTNPALPCLQMLQSREWEGRIGWSPLPQGQVQRLGTLMCTKGTAHPCHHSKNCSSSQWARDETCRYQHHSIKSQRPPTNTQWIIRRP